VLTQSCDRKKYTNLSTTRSTQSSKHTPDGGAGVSSSMEWNELAHASSAP